jgi:hypothetical protein
VTIGSYTATSLFNVGTSAQFQVNSTGQIVKYNNSIPASGMVAIGDGTKMDFSANPSVTSLSIGTGQIHIAGGADPGVSVAGDFWYNTTLKSHKFYTDAGMVGNVTVIYNNTADSNTVSNTTTETDFDKSFTFPVNSLTVGKIIRIKAYGKYGCTNASPTLAIRLYVGTNALTSGNISMTAVAETTQGWTFEGICIIRTIGVSGTMMSDSWGIYQTQRHWAACQPGTLAIDTTATALVKLSAQWGTAAAANTITIENITIEVLN